VQHLEYSFVWGWNLVTSESRSEIFGKFWECGAGEERRRPVGLIVWEMKEMLT